MFDQEHRTFVFRPGPLFAKIVLVDEINRATPKTQSALLEAMGERQITVDGVTRQLPEPFLLVATENPIEYEGTFPLPEAQLDRFFLRASLGYPGEQAELQVVREQRHGHPIDTLQPVLAVDELIALRRAVEDVYLDDLLEEWIVRDSSARRATSTASMSGIGAGVARAREDVTRLGPPPRARPRPAEDVVQLFVPVLGHRLVLSATFVADSRHVSSERALEQLRDACSSACRPRGRTGRCPRPLRSVPVLREGTFPLVPRHRLTGIPFGAALSTRRGRGMDLAGSRPYEPGDPISSIDWHASARLRRPARRSSSSSANASRRRRRGSSW